MRRTPALHGPIIRCASDGPVFSGPGTASLEAKDNIQTDVPVRGLLTLLGNWHHIGVTLMPAMRSRVRLNTLSTIAVAVFALSVLGISRWDSMFLDGGILVLRLVLEHPEHQPPVRGADRRSEGHARLMTSLYLLALQGSMATGSFFFGVIAEHPWSAPAS